MKLDKISRQIKRNITNSKGWKTKRKIIVIESDDWGSIRMPSKEAYESLVGKNYISKNNRYAKYDSLATTQDLTALFDVLSKFRDIRGASPKITANTIMANPDFKKIEQDNFQNYYYESFLDTLQSYPGCAGSFDIWKQGMAAGLFVPQLHGREHINISRWMKGLQQKNEALLYAFGHKTFLFNSGSSESSESMAAAFNFDNDREKAVVIKAIQEAYKQFSDVFGFDSKTFIAPNYTWNEDVDQTTSALGVKTLQASVVQNLVKTNGEKNSKVRHYMGERNKHNQLITIRNCYFEPSLMNYRENAVPNCLKDISNAFFWKKPAIITSHRLTFIGAVDEQNRIENLRLLEKLLSEILKRWPDAEFMDSAQLCDLMWKENKE